VSGQSLSILMIPGKTFPCQHPVLETVYTQILPRRGYRIEWVMSRAFGSQLPEQASWNQSVVHLTNGSARKVIARAWKLLQEGSFDLLQVRSGIQAGLFGVFAQRHFAVPLIFQLSYNRSIHLRAQVNSGLVPNQWLVRQTARIKQLLLDFILRRAQLVLPISDTMTDELVARGVPRAKLQSFPPAFDPEWNASSDARPRIRQELGLDDKFVAIYFGSMRRIRQLDFLLRAMQMVLQEEPQSKLVMLGGYPGQRDLAFLQETATQLGVAHAIHFVGRVSRSKVPDYVVAADISLCPIPPTPIYWHSYPIKVIESLGLGVPVVANVIPESKRLIEASGGGLCVPYEECSFARAMLTLFRDSMRNNKGAAGCRYVLAHHTYNAIADQLEARYHALLHCTSTRD
jgi:glycosyltransferase involved in cell wall biosynthesis